MADITVEWRMEKWLVNTFDTTNLQKYEFFVAGLQDTTWQFIILPEINLVQREGYDNHLRVSIGRSLLGDLGPNEVKVECEFDLLLVQKETDAPRSLRGNSPAKVVKKSFERGGESELVNLITLRALDALEDDDLLLFRCRIWPQDSSPFTLPVRHLVRSHLGSIGYFTWTVKDFTFLQKGKRIHRFLKKNSLNLTFAIFLGHDNDTICIQEISGRQDFCIRSISFLEADGRKSLCLRQYLPRLVLGKPVEMPFLFRKSQYLQDRKKFPPNNQLILYLHVKRGLTSGIIEKVIDDSVDENSITVSSTSQFPYTCPGIDQSYLLTHGPFTDFELRIGSHKIQVHKNILDTLSPVFMTMVTNQMREASQQSLDIYDVELDTVKHILDFMYLHSLPDLDWDSTLKLYSAAYKYAIADLIKKCSGILKSKCLSIAE